MHHLLEDKRILDPMSRISEILFGLIMALTFTGSLSAAMADRAKEQGKQMPDPERKDVCKWLKKK